MFELSFGELLVIGAVALIVLGPEKLPKVAHTLGALLGRLQRFVANVKSDINREVELENLRQLQAQMTAAGQQIRQEIQQSLEPVAQTLADTVESARDAVHEAQAGPADTFPESPPAPDNLAVADRFPADEGFLPAQEPAIAQPDLFSILDPAPEPLRRDRR